MGSADKLQQRIDIIERERGELALANEDLKRQLENQIKARRRAHRIAYAAIDVAVKAED